MTTTRCHHYDDDTDVVMTFDVMTNLHVHRIWNWKGGNKLTQLNDAFIGHARQRHDLIGFSETRTVGVQPVRALLTFLLVGIHVFRTGVDSLQLRCVMHGLIVIKTLLFYLN